MAAENHTIMIVEDEILVRQIGADVLEEAGYSVLEAGSATEALEIIEKNPGIALVFTDVRMPGEMDGLDLATVVHDRWPNVRLLITSGHCRLGKTELPDSGQFLAKPYRANELVQQVENLLPRSRTQASR